MDSRQWVSAAALTVGVFVVVVFSNVKTATGAPPPSQVTVINTAANPVRITGDVSIRSGANGFSKYATASDTGELVVFLPGPLANGLYDPIVLEHASMRVLAHAGRAITAQLIIFPPDGGFEGRAVTHIPLIPQGGFGSLVLYSASEALRLYSLPASGSAVAFIVSCQGCEPADILSADVSISGQTNP